METTKQIVDFGAAGTIRQAAKYFAPKRGVAPSLVAGSSRNLLSPTALEELFLYQRTANGAGGTGTAVFQSIKGNSIVWNQLVQNGNFANGTTGWSITGAASVADNELSVTIGNNGNCACIQAVPCIAGHKYLVRFSARATASVNANLNILDVQTDSVALTTTRATFAYLITPATSGDKNFNLFTYRQTASAGEKVYIKDVNVIDLTLSTMSVTSVSDFTKFYNLPFYAPNPGAIKNNAATGMVTDGLNQWDEEMEEGYIDANGLPTESDTSLRSVNYIRVIPGANYYVKIPAATIRPVYYDANKQFISRDANTYANTTFTIPSGACYIKFYTTTGYGTTYKNDICINLSGARNGQYEPHWSDTTDLPITTATGKLNGEGESVVITPNGMAGVGTSYDEAIVEKGMWTKTIVRVGNRAYQEGDEDDATLLTDGVTTNYPLVTPEEYILDTPVPVVARVDENGTQTILPQGVDESGVPMTAPFAASVFYPEQMDKVYLTAADFKNFLDAAVEGGAITAYTMEWNAATGSYDFTVNQAAATLAAPAPSE